MSLTLTVITLVATIFCNLFLLSVVAKDQQGDALRQLFSLHIITIIGWAGSLLVLMGYAHSVAYPIFAASSTGYYLAQIVFVSATILFATNYWFVVRYVYGGYGSHPRNYIFIVLQATALLLCLLPNTLYTEFSVLPAGYISVVPGPYDPIYGIFLLAHLIVPIYLLRKKNTTTDANKQRQQRLLSYYYSIFLLASMTFNWLLPVYFEIFYFNAFGPTTSIILVIGIVHIIMRHQFLDIKFLIQRGLIYTVLFSFVALLFFVIVHTIGALFPYSDYSNNHYLNQIIGGIIATTLATLLIPKIDRYLRKKTDPIFFKDTYNYSDSLRTLSHKVNQNIRLENITKTSSSAIKKILRAKEVRILEIDHCGTTAIPTNNIPAKTLSVPITHKDVWIGCIEIEEKQSGDLYMNRDLSLIETFANQIATAFEKARLYKEVEDYSHELENRVAARTKEVETLQENRSQIMLDISHQLQTPLTVVKSNLELLQKRNPTDANIKAFEKSIDDVSGFIYQMLHLTELEHTVADKSVINLSVTLAELAEFYSVIGIEKNITVHTDIAPDIHIKANRRQLEEAITNIVSNAVKYMKPAEEKTDRDIKITLTSTHDTAQIKIADTGIGISPETLPNIFNRFYREKHTASAGNGIGLAITKQIISLHQGTVSATSMKNIGSTFLITLPKVLN